jgi:large subunit ribosomal protein L2
MKYKIGCSVLLKYLDYKSIFFCLEFNNNFKYARSAGTFCKILNLDVEKESVIIQLPSGLEKVVSYFSRATLGRASNLKHKEEFFSKAGYFRHKGVRPTVRGVAMNPVDHPHGGRTKTNSPELTP